MLVYESIEIGQPQPPTATTWVSPLVGVAIIPVEATIMPVKTSAFKMSALMCHGRVLCIECLLLAVRVVLAILAVFALAALAVSAILAILAVSAIPVLSAISAILAAPIALAAPAIPTLLVVSVILTVFYGLLLVVCKDFFGGLVA